MLIQFGRKPKRIDIGNNTDFEGCWLFIFHMSFDYSMYLHTLQYYIFAEVACHVCIKLHLCHMWLYGKARVLGEMQIIYYNMYNVWFGKTIKHVEKTSQTRKFLKIWRKVTIKIYHANATYKIDYRYYAIISTAASCL